MTTEAHEARDQSIREAWRERPETQSCCMFDRATGQRLGCSPKTVQRRRTKMNLVDQKRAPRAFVKAARELADYDTKDLEAELERRKELNR